VYKRALSWVLILFCLAQVQAKPSVLERAGKNFKSCALVQMSLTHQFSWTLTNETMTMDGLLLASPDGRFRLDLGPTHVFSDGQSVWRWEEGGLQVLKEARDNSGLALFPQDLLLNPQEVFHLIDREKLGGDTLRLSLEPRQDSAFMQDIQLDMLVKKKMLRPLALRFQDFGGNKHEYQIHDLVFLETLSDSLLKEITFSLPEGFELIEMDGLSQ
jgi:outer membrane lipoprotein-sorting protein